MSIHMPVDRMRLLDIFVFRPRDSCLRALYMLHIFMSPALPKSSFLKIARRMLHSVHSLWIISLWTRENGHSCGF